MADDNQDNDDDGLPEPNGVIRARSQAMVDALRFAGWGRRRRDADRPIEE